MVVVRAVSSLVHVMVREELYIRCRSAASWSSSRRPPLDETKRRADAKVSACVCVFLCVRAS